MQGFWSLSRPPLHPKPGFRLPVNIAALLPVDTKLVTDSLLLDKEKVRNGKQLGGRDWGLSP